MKIKVILLIYKERSQIIFGQNASKHDHSVPARNNANICTGKCYTYGIKLFLK